MLTVPLLLAGSSALGAEPAGCTRRFVKTDDPSLLQPTSFIAKDGRGHGVLATTNDPDPASPMIYHIDLHNPLYPEPMYAEISGFKFRGIGVLNNSSTLVIAAPHEYPPLSCLQVISPPPKIKICFENGCFLLD